MGPSSDSPGCARADYAGASLGRPGRTVSQACSMIQSTADCSEVNVPQYRSDPLDQTICTRQILPAWAARSWFDLRLAYFLGASAKQTNKTGEIGNGAARVVPRRPAPAFGPLAPKIPG